MPATYEPIASTTLGSSTSGVTFSSIPSTYTDLKLVVFVSSTSLSGKGVAIRFNSDTGNNYYTTELYGSGSSSGSGTGVNDYILLANSGGATSNTLPGLFIADIINYAGSTYKMLLTNTSGDLGAGTGSVGRSIGIWKNTNSINTIRVSLYTDGSANFNSGTVMTLYGIKAA